MVASIFYYFSQSNALTTTNQQATGDYTLGNLFTGNISSYVNWKIASNSTGSSSQLVTYTNGNILTSDGNYYVYPSTACFLEGTTVLCKINGLEAYVPIEEMEKGMLVKTSTQGYKSVIQLGSRFMKNPGTSERIEDRLYKCSKDTYPELSQDLILTGCHSILVGSLTENQQNEIKKRFNRIFVTENKYRLMACVDERATPWTKEGTYMVWNLALENDNVKANYGVFVNGGLLVETCCIQFMLEKSNMKLL